MEKGIVYFIGAGPGDPRLLTLRGAELLRRASHVFIDAEVHPDVVPPGPIERTIVLRGRGMQHSDAILALARSGHKVARVFSGDPLLFRWGDEEVGRVALAGIPIEIVAGVTSVTAASAYGGLVLVRSSDASPSVAFAAIRDVAELHDWTKLSLATDTIALVTDAEHVEELTSTLTYYGRAPSTPAALLQDVSMPTQKVATGTLVDMRKLAAQFGKGEVMLLVGEPLSLRETIRWFDVRPLFGKRVLVLRAAEQIASAADIIRERGGNPIAISAIDIRPASDPEPLRKAVSELDRYGWVVFTSANTVRFVFDALNEARLDSRAIRGKVAAIGPGTSAALEAHGIRPDVLPSEHRAEGLAKDLLEAMKPGERVLLPRAKIARDMLPDALRAAGHSVDVVTAYETHPPDPQRQAALREAVAKADAVLLTSSSTAQNLLDALGGPPPERLVVASIGPITTEAARKLGFRVDATAEVYTLDGIVESLEAFFARR
jgi:uroporphyrinogen III methyltransferase/synthase